ncbi:MAG: glycoside hydrolase family 38 C-terminal domain-containing protein, partial [Bryobacteraceae bacterium]
MRRRTFLGTMAAVPAVASPATYSIYVVPHTHIDIEWYWTYDKTRVMCIKLLRQALDMLRVDARYTFVQDQALAMKPFWEDLNAKERKLLLSLIKEGRWEIAGGTWAQAENAEPDFESLSRQFLHAKPWLEQTFQTSIRTYWDIDVFGHTRQVPQLVARAGIPYCVFMRDASKEAGTKIRNPFWWHAPDGSKVLTYWLAGSYSVHARNVAVALRAQAAHNAEGNSKLLLPWGDDLSEPTETTAAIETRIRAAATQIGLSLGEVIFSTPSRYFDAVLKSGVDLPTFDQDFNPPLAIADLRGLYGERPKAKLASRAAEESLTTGEKLSTLAGLTGFPYPAAELRSGWNKLLFNQSHDGAGGSHIDAVYRDAMSRYGAAIEAGRDAAAEALYALSRNIDTSPGGVYPFLVFNPQSFHRTELARYNALFRDKLNTFRVTDHTGAPVPFRIVTANRAKPDRALQMAVIDVLAGVPGLGYKLYRIEPVEGMARAPEWRPGSDEVSNRFFTLRLDRVTGTLRSVVDRRTGQELFDASAYFVNELVLAEERDPSMEGMVYLTGREVRGRTFTADAIQQAVDEIGTRLRIAGPFLGGRRVQEIEIYNEIPRIDFTTLLDGFPGRDGLLTVVFPVRQAGRTIYDTHGATTERPDGIFCAHGYVDVTTSQGGVAILNRGTGGHQIQNGVVKLILLRSITAYPSYHSELAAERGSHSFSYSIYPHAGVAPQGGVAWQAHSFNSPLRVISTDAHPGTLPGAHSFASTESGNFRITALKRAEDGEGFILRGHEVYGTDGRVRLRLGFPVARAWLSDLIEHIGTELPVRGD